MCLLHSFHFTAKNKIHSGQNQFHLIQIQKDFYLQNSKSQKSIRMLSSLKRKKKTLIH